jgi:hypothetical protein
MWKCSKCHEAIDDSFGACWKCGTSVDGVEDPDFRSLSEGEEVTEEWAESYSQPEVRGSRTKLTCEVCGSEKIIPEVRILDQGEYSNGRLQVMICGNPNAFLFKDKLMGELKAHVCGECGHTELKVTNPQALYEKYLESRRSK